MGDVSEFLSRHESEFSMLDNGRVKCLVSGHEILPQLSAIEAYLQSKKYKWAKFEKHELTKLQPHIVQHPEFKDKLLCQLTGKVVNKVEEAVWKHVMGKRFQNILQEIEVGKQKETDVGKEAHAPVEKPVEEDAMSKGGSAGGAAKLPAAGETAGEMMQGEACAKPTSADGKSVKEKNKKKRRKKKKKASDGAVVANGAGLVKQPAEVTGGKRSRAPEQDCVEMDVERESNGDGEEEAAGAELDDSNEEADFWVPPSGARWDGDAGGKRWKKKPVNAQCQQEGESMDVDMEEAHGAGMEDGDGDGEEDVIETRVKRTTAAVGPVGCAPQKKKKKRSKGQPMESSH